jgi:hypothetical protein
MDYGRLVRRPADQFSEERCKEPPLTVQWHARCDSVFQR